ncbi:hypothetical protein N9L06_04500 [Mariniblastus sp.]|nr:hypothetical protein [Mariniblastus sp.]
MSDERLIPISTTRFGWWLFLSAELMMFAGVIGASMVLRSGVPASEWPEPSWVKSHWCIGMVTIVLLLSIGWLLRRAIKQRRQQKQLAASAEETSHRLPWIAFAIACSVFSAVVIGLDYQSKISLGLFPSRTQPNVYAAADLDYLSGVTARANAQIAVLEQKTDRDSIEDRKLKQWKLIRDGMINWTRRTVGRSDDPNMRELSLAQLANQIYPTRADPRLAKFAQDETAEVTQRLSLANERLKSLSPDETIAKQSGQQEINQLQQRLLFMKFVADVDHPLQPLVKYALPKVIPGGPTWIANYWLLTGFLLIHQVIGVSLLVVLVLRKSDEASADTLQNVTAFWYFVVITGIITASLVWII